MNYFAFSGLVNALVSTLCGTIVYLQDRSSYKNQICYILFGDSYLVLFLFLLAIKHGERNSASYGERTHVWIYFYPTFTITSSVFNVRPKNKIS